MAKGSWKPAAGLGKLSQWPVSGCQVLNPCPAAQLDRKGKLVGARSWDGESLCIRGSCICHLAEWHSEVSQPLNGPERLGARSAEAFPSLAHDLSASSLPPMPSQLPQLWHSSLHCPVLLWSSLRWIRLPCPCCRAPSHATVSGLCPTSPCTPLVSLEECKEQGCFPVVKSQEGFHYRMMPPTLPVSWLAACAGHSPGVGTCAAICGSCCFSAASSCHLTACSPPFHPGREEGQVMGSPNDGVAQEAAISSHA